MATKKKMYQRPDGLFEKQVTVNGKRHLFRGKTQREVMLKISEFTEKTEKGPLFKEVSELWLDQYVKDNPSSERGITGHYRRVIEKFGDMRIKDITTQDVSAFLNTLSDFAKKTVRDQKSVLNQIMVVAINTGYITVNPVASAILPKNLKSTRRELPTAEELSVVKSSLNLEHGFYAYFLLYTGCRRSEALALKYKDMDMVNNQIIIDKAVYFKGNQANLKGTKTSAGTRVVPILNNLKEVMPVGDPEHYIFSNNTKMLSNNQERRRWYKYQKETGLTITPHQLRHAYATILYEAGIDERMAMELLGHANISTTKEIYTHISSQKRAKTISQLNAFVTQNTQ